MHRTITDPQGHDWDVAVGRESYGMQVWLFSPKNGGEVRKALMYASTRLDAQTELTEASDEQLLERLDASVPWTSASPI